MPSTNVFNELSAKIYSEKNLTVCNAVYFRLCIDLMHITAPVTAEGFDGSHLARYAECHHPKFAECLPNPHWLPLIDSSGGYIKPPFYIAWLTCLPFTIRQNFGREKIESICRGQI